MLDSLRQESREGTTSKLEQRARLALNGIGVNVSRLSDYQDARLPAGFFILSSGALAPLVQVYVWAPGTRPAGERITPKDISLQPYGDTMVRCLNYISKAMSEMQHSLLRFVEVIFFLATKAVHDWITRPYADLDDDEVAEIEAAMLDPLGHGGRVYRDLVACYRGAHAHS